MKVFFWFFLILKFLMISGITVEIRKRKIAKRAIFLCMLPMLLTVGSGYLFYLQLNSDLNKNAIEAYFDSKCDGYVMKPLEDPIEVQACENEYLVKAKNGKIVMLKEKK